MRGRRRRSGGCWKRVAMRRGDEGNEILWLGIEGGGEGEGDGELRGDDGIW